ncbi:MAG: PKD domain-containing protein, partial [Acidobacteriota bacterium]|nr:PKD domain-containing protein [Acidobacteriota bacterium]
TRREVKQASVSHQYRATGHYKVFASVVAPERAYGDDNNPPIARVPSVTLSAAPRSQAAGRAVTFQAQITSRYPDLKYRFTFADGTQTGWQDSSETSHAYRTAGTYLAYVDIGAAENGRVKQLGGSVRQPIQVLPAALGPVELSASPAPVEAGKSVTLNARVSSNDPNVRYRFVFGDGSRAGNWQNSSQTTHKYSASGSYPAAVDVGLATGGSIRPIGSARRSVEVSSPPRVAVTLNASPTSIQTGDSVTFTAKADSGNNKLRYRFFYGDGSSSSGWQSNAQTVHSYSEAGSYPAYVEVAGTRNGRQLSVVRSGTSEISVTSPLAVTPSPSPGNPAGPTTQTSRPGGAEQNGGDQTGQTSSEGNSSSSSLLLTSIGDAARRNWWKLLLVVALLLFAYKLLMPLFKPATSFRAVTDPGGSELQGGAKGLNIDSRVILRPNIAEGKYLVFTDGPHVVTNIRREDA